MRVSFVVLHYESVFDTEECIISLLQYISDNVDIIVVDNGSVVGKIDEIVHRYEDNIHIHFIKSNTNLGFAKGNNLGFEYAKYELKSEIIVLANNDLIFRQRNFVEELISKQKELKFDVAGPKIISLVDNKNQNPVQRIYKSIEDVNKRVLKFRILYALSFLNLDKFARAFFGGKTECQLECPKDYQLHGACMFFSGRFIEKFDGLYPRTYMYGEESILKAMVEKEKMNMLYIDSLSVFHKEGSSTQKVWGKGVRQRQFFYKWNINSCLELKKVMQLR